jgi:hypothetical protein
VPCCAIANLHITLHSPRFSITILSYALPLLCYASLHLPDALHRFTTLSHR